MDAGRATMFPPDFKIGGAEKPEENNFAENLKFGIVINLRKRYHKDITERKKNTNEKDPKMSTSNAELLRVQLRWMTEKDLDAVFELEQKSAVKPWNAEEFAMILMHSNAVGMVVEYQSRIIGYIVYETLDDAFVIKNIAVLPEFQRKGVGSQMIARVACRLTRGIRSVMLLSVGETNLDAQLFFRSLGFKAVNICRADEEHPEDAYIMQYRHHTRVLPTELVMM